MTHHRPLRHAIPAAVLLAAFASGCGLLFREAPAPPPDAAPPDTAVVADPLPAHEPAGLPSTTLPAGFGTLRQEEISMRLDRGELRMIVTPLAESITRTAAPDTWERLSSLAGAHRSSLRERTGSEAIQLFLVGMHAESRAVPFEPEDLTIVSRGLRFRPLEIRGLTPGWDRNRVGPRETLLAVYVFPDQIDLERAIELEYQEVRSRDWESVLPRVQAERGRVRARAGGSGQPSMP